MVFDLSLVRCADMRAVVRIVVVVWGVGVCECMPSACVVQVATHGSDLQGTAVLIVWHVLTTLMTATITLVGAATTLQP